MNLLEFIWDERKASLNLKKHGVSFEEAKTIFYSPHLDIFYDPHHSHNQDRYIAIGVSNKNRLLLVVHCENTDGTTVRIISARKATRNERDSLKKGFI
jgi:uncharacterized protein